MQEMVIWSLGQEDPLEYGMATYSRILLHGESHGWRSLVVYSQWGLKDSNMPEATEHAHMYPH